MSPVQWNNIRCSGYIARFTKTGLGHWGHRECLGIGASTCPKKLLQSCSRTTLERRGSGDSELIQSLRVIEVTEDLVHSAYTWPQIWHTVCSKLQNINTVLDRRSNSMPCTKAFRDLNGPQPSHPLATVSTVQTSRAKWGKYMQKVLHAKQSLATIVETLSMSSRKAGRRLDTSVNA